MTLGRLVFIALVFLATQPAGATNVTVLATYQNPTCEKANQFWLSVASHDFKVEMKTGRTIDQSHGINCNAPLNMRSGTDFSDSFHLIDLFVTLYDLPDTKFMPNESGVSPDFYKYVRGNVRTFVIAPREEDADERYFKAEAVAAATGPGEVSIFANFMNGVHTRAQKMGWHKVHEARHLEGGHATDHVTCNAEKSGQPACDDDFTGGGTGGAFNYSFMVLWWLWRQSTDYHGPESKLELREMAVKEFENHFNNGTTQARLKWLGPE